MSDERIINPPQLGRPAGFSHGVAVTEGTWVYLAGQAGSDAAGEIIAPGDLTAQADAALGNLLAVVAAAGGRPEHVVKLVWFVTDMAAYREARAELGAVWRRHFGRYFPAMTLVAVTELVDPNAVVEIDGIAVVPPAEGQGRLERVEAARAPAGAASAPTWAVGSERRTNGPRERDTS